MGKSRRGACDPNTAFPNRADARDSLAPMSGASAKQKQHSCPGILAPSLASQTHFAAARLVALSSLTWPHEAWKTQTRSQQIRLGLVLWPLY